MEVKRQSNSSFKVFLSHRYKSPAVNEYFFGLFENEAEIQFEVDTGIIATNITRLERLIRNSDAFVGIYPYSSEDPVPPKRSELLKASQYFRLELDLAIRSRKPSLIFVDSRYGNIFNAPRSILQCFFDYRELLSVGENPSEATFRQYINLFQNTVVASINYKISRPLNSELGSSTVGLLLPQASDVEKAYSNEHLELAKSQFEEFSIDTIHLSWPPILSNKLYRSIEDLDWLIVDLSERTASTGIVSFLHGQFVPMVRLMYIKHDLPVGEKASQLESTLFGAYEVGYSKDIVRWSDNASLSSGLQNRIETIYTPSRLISNRLEANKYFRSAALRKEAVFVSYSSKDQEITAELVYALKTHFQEVFDYRDRGESIKPGQPWLRETFDSLSNSAIGIMILSDSYLRSNYCLGEAREMVNLQLDSKMQVFPIKIQKR